MVGGLATGHLNKKRCKHKQSHTHKGVSWKHGKAIDLKAYPQPCSSSSKAVTSKGSRTSPEDTNHRGPSVQLPELVGSLSFKHRKG